MTRFALLATAAPALLLGACTYAAPHSAPHHTQAYPHAQHAQYGAPYGAPHVANPCAITGTCPQGGYATAPRGQQVHPHHGPRGQYPGQHAYGQHAPAYGVPAYGAPQLRGLRRDHKPYAYGTLGLVSYDVDTDLVGLQGRVGYQPHPIFGAELEASVGIVDEDVSAQLQTEELPNARGDFMVDSQFAAFATARAPLGDRFSVLGRVGYHATDIGIELTDGTTRANVGEAVDGLAYGVGAEYALSPRSSLRADYTGYEFDSSTNQGFDSVSLGYLRKF